MYRYAKIEVGAASDSSLTDPTFGPRRAVFDQVKDLQEFSTVLRVAPGAAETQVSIAPVTTGYFIAVLSDYPVRVRLNGNTSTQFTLNSNNVAAVNVGAPLPDQCCFVMSGQVSSVYVQPIASAEQTANVKILVTGDPQSAYV